KSRRRNADDRERMPFDDKRAADDRRVAAVGGLPRVVAEDDDGRGRRAVVVWRYHAAAEGADAEGSEVGAAHELRTERPRTGIDAGPSRGDAPAAGLKRGNDLELWHVGDEPLVESERVKAPPILRGALVAAIVAVADTVETGRVRHRQRPQYHR